MLLVRGRLILSLLIQRYATLLRIRKKRLSMDLSKLLDHVQKVNILTAHAASELEPSLEGYSRRLWREVGA